MMLRVLSTSLLVSVASAIPADRLPGAVHGIGAEAADHMDMVETAFVAWKAEFNKTYVGLEHEARRLIFAETMALVASHNTDGHSWTMGLNQFSDMTHDEFASMMTLQPSDIGTEHSSADSRHVLMGDAPTEIDWRTTGIVGPVKNQEQCGSCWAFSTVVSIEGQLGKKNNNTYQSLSEQNLVDCVKDISIPGTEGSCCNGCQGGLMDFGFTYLKQDQDGQDATESAYPYTAADGTCDKTKEKGTGAITGYTDIGKGKELPDLKDAVGNVGPISIAVNAAAIFKSFQTYSSGIYDPYFCDGDKLDHGVALVGYGSESGKDYWILRNSWGDTWGEKGYMRIAMGSNKCGLANSASYPTV